MSDINRRAAIEAILFASGASVEAARLAQALEISEKEAVEAADALMEEYQAANRGITVIRLNGAYQMVSVKEYAPQIRTVMDLRRNTPLSQAYRQPDRQGFGGGKGQAGTSGQTAALRHDGKFSALLQFAEP